jgi:hypothetical protein
VREDDMGISYREKNGKYITCKDGVYLSLYIDQVIEMQAVLRKIRREHFWKRIVSVFKRGA